MDIPKPSRTFDIKINGETQTIIMSHGLFNEIMKVIPSPELITQLVVTDPFLREYVVRRVLTGNKPIKSDEELIDLFDYDVDADEMSDLVTWIAEHVLHFFTSAVAKTAKTGEKYQETVKALTQSSQSQPGAGS